MCIKLVSIKELYYDARPTKSQDKPWLSPQKKINLTHSVASKGKGTGKCKGHPSLHEEI